jgi:glycine cleavage system H lipoate-binding protein
MTTSDFLATYDAKVTEYLLALTYLLLFVPMWRFVHGAASGAEVSAQAGAGVSTAKAATAAEAKPARAPLGWFDLPAGVGLHAGHAWARTGDDGLITVGIDDFAQKLVGPERALLPAVGDQVLEGQPAFAIGDWVTTVPMRAPVGGRVVAINEAAGKAGTLRDPYGAGWLFKVKPSEGAGQARLMVDAAARSFLERSAEALALRVEPTLGHVLQDGGTPIQGIARALNGDAWAALARHFFQTER